MAGSGLTGFLQNFGGGEFLAILIVALVVLGPDRLPDFARSLGKGLHKLRTMTDGMQSQVRDVIDDPAMQPLRELGEFAVRPRQKLAEYALEAEAEERSRKEAESVRAARPDATPVDPATTAADDGPADAPVDGSAPQPAATTGTPAAPEVADDPEVPSRPEVSADSEVPGGAGAAVAPDGPATADADGPARETA